MDKATTIEINSFEIRESLPEQEIKTLNIARIGDRIRVSSYINTSDHQFAFDLT